jgi:molybdate transport system regulatory protein
MDTTEQVVWLRATASGIVWPMSTRLNIQLISDKHSGRIGPGKVRLLELLEETGSISAAARAMAMSYRQAWLLLDEINSVYGHALYETQQGGQGRGGASLTALGQQVVHDYRKFEAQCLTLAEQQFPLLYSPGRKKPLKTRGEAH